MILIFPCCTYPAKHGPAIICNVIIQNLESFSVSVITRPTWNLRLSRMFPVTSRKVKLKVWTFQWLRASRFHHLSIQAGHLNFSISSFKSWRSQPCGCLPKQKGAPPSFSHDSNLIQTLCLLAKSGSWNTVIQNHGIIQSNHISSVQSQTLC